MNRRSLILVAAATLLFLASVSGPVMRMLREPGNGEQVQRNAGPTTVRGSDASTLSASNFARERDDILARLREHLGRGESGAAMALGGRYFSLGDSELNALYETAAARESYRQRLEATRELVATQCTAVSARIAALQFVRAYSGASERTRAEALVLTRLSASEVRAPLLDVIEQPRPTDPPARDPLSAARAAHRARVHPYDAVAFRSDPVPEGIVCAWRLEGPLANEKRTWRVRLDFWLVPSPAGKSLDFAPLAYTEGSSAGPVASSRTVRSSAPVASTKPTKPSGP